MARRTSRRGPVDGCGACAFRTFAALCAVLSCDRKAFLKEGRLMTLMMYILIGVIVVAAIFFIIKGKK